jgi:ElaB/YqjD/DUF883 family membrane-anchored ribosome-binding protein
MSNDSASNFLDGAAAATDHVAQQALGAAQRSVAAVRTGTQHALDRAHTAGDQTVSYIRGEPVKAMLIAAAAGAALMALVNMAARSRDRS